MVVQQTGLNREEVGVQGVGGEAVHNHHVQCIGVLCRSQFAQEHVQFLHLSGGLDVVIREKHD